MGYRKLEHPKPEPRRSVDVTGSPGPVITVYSRGEANVAFPCFYVDEPDFDRLVPHDRPMHDHVGWPKPDRPDRSCQTFIDPKKGCGPVHPRMYLDPRRLIPIDLVGEDLYEDYTLQVGALSVAGRVCEDEPHVIRFRFDADLSAGDHAYTVWGWTGGGDRALFNGTMHVLPTQAVPE